MKADIHNNINLKHHNYLLGRNETSDLTTQQTMYLTPESRYSLPMWWDWLLYRLPVWRD